MKNIHLTCSVENILTNVKKKKYIEVITELPTEFLGHLKVYFSLILNYACINKITHYMHDTIR